jgi:membrane protease YdiL (CAAX protease family)
VGSFTVELMAAREHPLLLLPPRRTSATRARGAAALAYGVGAYAAVGAGAVGIAAALGRDPLSCEGWLGATGASSALLSLGLGVTIAAVTVTVSRSLVHRAAWARALHEGLRPAVHRAGDATLVAVAVSSGAAEELLFRGLLVPVLGVVASALVFGALHQIRGRARWGWMAWAALMGLVFGCVFAATGSLIGCVVAHVAVNLANLRYLRDHDPRPHAARLGGLLERDGFTPPPPSPPRSSARARSSSAAAR